MQVTLCEIRRSKNECRQRRSFFVSASFPTQRSCASDTHIIISLSSGVCLYLFVFVNVCMCL